MRPLLRTASLLALLLTAAGCASAARENSSAADNSSLSGDWRLSTLTDRGKPVSPIVGSATISFGAHGEASWYDGANTSGSSYRVSGGRITFTGGVSTTVGYLPGTSVAAIADAFASLERPRFSVSDNNLTLCTTRYEFGFVRQSRTQT